MYKNELTINDINDQLDEFSILYPSFKREDLFIIWFLRAYVTDDVELAARSVTNGKSDKGVDAVFVDDRSDIVFIIQSKFRQKYSVIEKRSEIISFCDIANIIMDKNGDEFKHYTIDMDPSTAEKLRNARNKLFKKNYPLQMFYVTLGRCSLSLTQEAIKIVKRHHSNIEIIDSRRVLLILKDYLDGVAPPIPTLELEMEQGQSVKVNGIMARYDIKRKIESWVFSMRGDTIEKLFEKHGTRLFARNIRGFLGSSMAVNRSMMNTLESEPECFFYYNNGITIICDKAEKHSHHGKDYLHVNNPQIINGQQTTRILANSGEYAKNASVLIKVMQIPREPSIKANDFESLVSRIVKSTNWQNAIKPSDLVSNDHRQIYLERELRKLGYLYLRKRQSKSEALKDARAKYYQAITKDELARAVAGCDLDPVHARAGVEKLFEDKMYFSIFPNSNPHFYLPRFWLRREVESFARGDRDCVYAKWVVLGFIWSKLEHLVRSEIGAKAFVDLCQRQQGELVNPLSRAIEKVFLTVLIYFRNTREDKNIDTSTFFYKLGRGREFRSFWDSSQNKKRKRTFERYWEKVEDAINSTDEY